MQTSHRLWLYHVYDQSYGEYCGYKLSFIRLISSQIILGGGGGGHVLAVLMPLVKTDQISTTYSCFNCKCCAFCITINPFCEISDLQRLYVF